MPAAAVPEGTMTWGVHITLASRWLDPAETALSHCCGQMRRRDMLEKIPVQLRNAGAAEIGDRTADLFAVQLDCPRRAGFSRDRRAPKCWAADHDELRPDRERLHDIAAAAKATVHNNGGPVERRTIVAQRDLVLGASNDEFEQAFRQALLRHDTQIVYVERILHIVAEHWLPLMFSASARRL